MATILLHEQDLLRRQRIRRKLESLGHSVWSATHLNETIPVLREVPVDLCILDADGYPAEELRQFASRWSGVRTLLHQSGEENAAAARGNGVVIKSPRGGTILNAVKRSL